MRRGITSRTLLLLVLASALALAMLAPWPVGARDEYGEQHGGEYAQVNLVSNGYVSAEITDPNLVNPWGVAASSTSPIWISNQATSTSTLYTITNIESGTGSPFVVAIPTTGTPGPQGPTGIVFNLAAAQMGFPIPGASGGVVAPNFIFASLNGTISGWSPTSTGGRADAVIAVRTPGAVYTGLALGMVGSAMDLYAADSTPPPDGGIKVFNASFAPVNLGSDAFAIRWLPPLPSDEAWAPYNIANLGGNMFVTYVPIPATGGQPIVGFGHGVVAEFTTTGEFIRIVERRGPLNDPWGMVMAPAQFGRFSNDLLVGNFGDGKILAYRQHHDGRFTFEAEMVGTDHRPLRNGFLWALWFGNGADGADPDTLYITTGGADQSKDGLFAAITPAPKD